MRLGYNVILWEQNRRFDAASMKVTILRQFQTTTRYIPKINLNIILRVPQYPKRTFFKGFFMEILYGMYSCLPHPRKPPRPSYLLTNYLLCPYIGAITEFLVMSYPVTRLPVSHFIILNHSHVPPPLPNVSAEWIALMLCAWVVPGSNLGRRPAILRFFVVFLNTARQMPG
jgi:hypothetical protein